MPKIVHEVNFDGLVGSTHNYSGLSLDNFACTIHKAAPSNPREAALQGLKKMKFLADLGVKQAVLPPHPRPYLPLLRNLGFEDPKDILLEKVYKTDPVLLSAAMSAAAMWTANAATVTPSTDSRDGKVHLTPANLVSECHRSIEAEHTERILRQIFKNTEYFSIHQPLQGTSALADEGAANHTRFCSNHSHPGLHLFIYGRQAFNKKGEHPLKFIPRQTLEASQAIARRHQIDPARCVFIQQNPKAIDHGVFHNDVISVGNESTFLFHEEAFINTSSVIEKLSDQFQELYGKRLKFIKVPTEVLSLEESVATYLFNSQLVTTARGKQVLILPEECRTHEKIIRFLLNHFERDDLHFIDIRQSMHNGGGPACLRLRVPLNEEEMTCIPESIWLTDNFYKKLCHWVESHYREHLEPRDLADPELWKESERALLALESILKIGNE